jgi:hypothetical protein
VIPNGTYIVGRNDINFYGLTIPEGVTVMGESRQGVILKQAPAIAASVRLFYINGDDVTIANMTLDGNKITQSVNDQRHGIFVNENTSRSRIERVTAKNFSGDGIFFYSNANKGLVFDCYCLDNDRNGLTLAGLATDGCTIIGGQFIGNAAQQVDSEAGGATDNVALVGSYLDADGGNDFALTCSGYSRTARSTGWLVHGCTINGPVNAVWCDGLSLQGNRITSNSTDKPAIKLHRKCVGVSIVGNVLKATANAADDSVIYIEGADNTDGDRSARIVIANNDIVNTQANGYGILGLAMEDIVIANNTIIGGGAVAAGYWGIYLRSTLSSFPVSSARVFGNTVKNFGSGAVAFAGSGAATITAANVSHNCFTSDVASVQDIGVSFNVDGTNAVQQATWIGNDCTGNTTTEISDYPSSGVVLVGGNHGAPGAIYSCTGTPEGVITAGIGSLALRRDGGASTTLYVKTSGTGNTGWTAK